VPRALGSLSHGNGVSMVLLCGDVPRWITKHEHNSRWGSEGELRARVFFVEGNNPASGSSPSTGSDGVGLVRTLPNSRQQYSLEKEGAGFEEASI
jgi:predicted phosphodiesterase